MTSVETERGIRTLLRLRAESGATPIVALFSEEYKLGAVAFARRANDARNTSNGLCGSQALYDDLTTPA